MSANGMVRPCSCPASILNWQGAPKTRSTPCLRNSIPQSPAQESAEGILSGARFVKGPNVGRTLERGDLGSAMRPKIQLSGLWGTGKGEARTALLEGTEAGAAGSIIKASGVGAKDRQRLIQRTAVYGPVRTVVWEGRSREAPPYPYFQYLLASG